MYDTCGVPSPAMPAELEESDDVGAEDQEVADQRTAPDPELPTEAEIEDHRIDHTPYRSWCTWCRRGRGLGERRGRGAKEAHTVPILAMDYFFITKEDIETKESMVQLGFEL